MRPALDNSFCAGDGCIDLAENGSEYCSACFGAALALSISTVRSAREGSGVFPVAAPHHAITARYAGHRIELDPVAMTARVDGGEWQGFHTVFGCQATQVEEMYPLELALRDACVDAYKRFDGRELSDDERHRFSFLKGVANDARDVE